MRAHRCLTGRALFLAALVLILASSGAAPVGAQATRTWVSGVGDDVNPCSRTAPCKTLAGTISKTAAGGEINAIDPNGFGAVTITKSITIVAAGVTGGILASGTNGVNVSAGPNDVVVLRGLDIEGAGTGQNGIRFLSGKALHVEQVTIRGFRAGAGRGIDMQVSADAELYVSGSQIANNSGAGIYVKTPNGIGPARVTISDTRLLNNAVGLDARDAAQVIVKDSVAAGNAGAGFRAQGDNAGAQMSLDSVMATFNGTGIILGGPGAPGNRSASLLMRRSAIWGNTVGGIDAAANTSTSSAGDNRILDPDVADQPPNCSPRPKVTVTTAQNGAGQLLATVSVASNAGGGQNTIQSMNFGPAANARIDVPNGALNSTGSVNQPQPSLTTQLSFNVRREAAGAFTVPFNVVDGCGSWATFVGGGAGVP